MTDAGLLTWLLLIPTPAAASAAAAAAAAAASAADLGVESEADRLPPVLARVVAQHSSVLSLSDNTHTHTQHLFSFNKQ